MLAVLKRKARMRSADMVMKFVDRLIKPFQNEMGGASMVSVVGWALVAVLVIVLVWGLVSGWLPSFVNSIFARLENLG
ncbi:MAG: hypothetical protein BAA01_11440 [Bacillus thermozeamaize]|uniref:Uncharacterized protein n=1 Tax=Bacillus thermozeamaize TaxID=230954 RepID=A0A1Y3PGV3_9BACI|nr:MAG: hypothetical protein BAA01_11440 [Bacillus thermozeamaize]